MRFFSITTTQLAIFLFFLLIIRIIAYFIYRKKPQDKRYIFSEKIDKIINENIDSIIIAGITALIIITYIVRPFYIPTESMYPTLKRWDYILVNEFIYRFKQPQRKDIVVFHPPSGANAEGKEYIKRIVALEGDTIEIKEGKLYLNGKPGEEPYVLYPPDYEYPKTKIPQGHLFVMGDNRPNSGDSHIWGFLPRKSIVGKAFIILWPPARMGILR